MFLVTVYPLETCDFKKQTPRRRLASRISISTKTQPGWAEQSPKLAGGNGDAGWFIIKR